MVKSNAACELREAGASGVSGRIELEQAGNGDHTMFKYTIRGLKAGPHRLDMLKAEDVFHQDAGSEGDAITIARIVSNTEGVSEGTFTSHAALELHLGRGLVVQDDVGSLTNASDSPIRPPVNGKRSRVDNRAAHVWRARLAGGEITAGAYSRPRGQLLGPMAEVARPVLEMFASWINAAKYSPKDSDARQCECDDCTSALSNEPSSAPKAKRSRKSRGVAVLETADLLAS